MKSEAHAKLEKGYAGTYLATNEIILVARLTQNRILGLNLSVLLRNHPKFSKTADLSQTWQF